MYSMQFDFYYFPLFLFTPSSERPCLWAIRHTLTIFGRQIYWFDNSNRMFIRSEFFRSLISVSVGFAGRSNQCVQCFTPCASKLKIDNRPTERWTVNDFRTFFFGSIEKFTSRTHTNTPDIRRSRRCVVKASLPNRSTAHHPKNSKKKFYWNGNLSAFSPHFSRPQQNGWNTCKINGKMHFEQVDELLPFVTERIGHIPRAKTTFHSVDGCRYGRPHRRGDSCVGWCLWLSLLHSQKPH